MNNTLLAELAFELLRIHLGRHDIPLDVDSVQMAEKDELVMFRGIHPSIPDSVYPVLTETGVETINRMVDALFEGMVAR